MFHAIDDRVSPIAISRARFADLVATLAGEGWRSLSIAEAIAGHAHGGWPQKSLAITFDDGFGSFGELAWPVLRQHAFIASVFVVADYVGRTNAWPGQPSWVPQLPLLGWSDLAALAREGVEVGSHSLTHRSLDLTAPSDLHQEIDTSRRQIADRLGLPVDAFAYPYGRTSPAAETLVAEHYRIGFGTRLDFTHPGSPLHCLDRLDAYYFTPALTRALGSLPSRMYFAVRRLGRSIRGK